MTLDRGDRTVVIEQPPLRSEQRMVRTESRGSSSYGPGASEQARRIVVLVFGLIQILIGARFVLLLLGANDTNGLVSGVFNMSQLFVAPFDGILRTNSLSSTGGSVLDLTSVLAFVGWTVVEVIVIWVVGIFRRDRASVGA